MKETLEFNDLLKKSGLDPTDVKIYKHADKNKKDSRITSSRYSMWLSEPENFENYQEYQGGINPFSRDYLASFIETPLKESLFIGVYKVDHSKTEKVDEEGKEIYHYSLKKTEYLEEWIGRVFVDWKKAYNERQASIKAEKYNFEILKINEMLDDSFVGFDNFICDIRKIDSLSSSTKNYLKISKGVYLLSCGKACKLYVGSAYGEDGFLGRWKNYQESDDGGNKLLIEHNKECDASYQASLLYIASSTESKDEIIRKENSWKEKLLTRHCSFGLNANLG